MSDFEQKTEVTRVVSAAPSPSSVPVATDCLVVIYTKEPTLLGKRFVLDYGPVRVGRGSDNQIVLDGDSVSRRHCFFEQRADGWCIVDNGSTNGTYCNDAVIRPDATLRNGDRIKVGPTIFKFLSGADVESQYHEEIYQMTIVDGLTQVHNKRYLFEALDREMVRGRRNERDLALLLFDIDHFKRVNDVHGHLAGDHVLKEIARLVAGKLRRDEVIARYGGEEFVVVLPETSLDDAAALAETLRRAVADHTIEFLTDTIQITISIGAALLIEGDKAGSDLIRRADEKLYEAKNGGRNRVCV